MMRCFVIIVLWMHATEDIRAQVVPARPTTLQGRIVLEWAGEEPLFRISGIAQSADGRLFVAEREDSRVREYNPQTRRERVLLRKGAGPREVVSPCCMSVTSDGFLVVRDNGNGRWVGIRVTGAPESTFVVRQAAPTGNAEFATPVRANLFADLYWSAYPSNGRRGQRRVRWVSTSGSITDSLSHPMETWDSTSKFEQRYQSGRSNGTRYAYPLFGRRTLRASSTTGLVAEANSDRYLIRVYAANGRQLAEIRRDGEAGPLLSAADRDAARVQRGVDARRMQVAEDRLRFSISERKPPLEDLRFIEDTLLLVRRAVATGAPREADGYGSSGRHWFTLRWPADIRLLEYDPARRRGLGVRLTEDGEESVVVVDFSAP